MKSFPGYLLLFIVLGFIQELNAAQLFQRRINQWKNNKYDGLWISWSDSSGKKIESKGHYKDGHERGVWRYFYEDGTPRKIERYSKKGISTKYYYPNGKMKSKGKAIVDYEEDFLHYYYQGEWTYYNEDGKPEQVITYERGNEVDHRKAGKAKKQ